MLKKIFWIFAIYMVFVQGDMHYDTDNYDGWIPITNGNALNIRISEHPPSINYDFSETASISNEDEFIKIVTPRSLQTKEDYFASRDVKVKNNFECKRNGVTMCPEECENVNTEAKVTLPAIFISPNKITRRAKKLVESDLIDTTSDSPTLKEEEVTTSTNYKTYKTSTESIRKVYEVTENPVLIDTKAAESKNTEALGYIYDPPKLLHSPSKLNYFDLLSKTLLKYNIDTNDQLQNYALSKQNKNILMPNTLNVPRGFNSLNHLPVDPLLAVFLSNYGYYLPGVYGVEANYKNLYGYLASNNIHNNRPFGLYKVNSDTDSSSLGRNFSGYLAKVN